MRNLILASVLFLASLSAQADSLIPLLPPDSGIPGVRQVQCAASGFSADGLKVNGGCTYKTSCSTFRCQPPAYSYSVSWALDGTATLGAKGGKPYQQGTGIEITLDGHPYYYVSTSVLGAIVADTQGGVVLWQP